jgi:hypothetical protein
MRIKVCGAAAALAAVAGVGAITPTGPAGAAVNFAGVATADAARVTVVVPNAPATSSIVDTGVTSAQAVVTSAGTSRAYASNPYPGENAVTIHGTLAGFGVAGVPAYPLYAESMHPGTPKAEIGNGPFHLSAASTATSSEGAATSGQGGDQSALLTSAVTSVRQEGDGSVLSKAESKVQGFVAGPLKIASIVSSAQTKLPATGGALEKASSLEVTGMSVNDVAVQLTDKGLVAQGQTVPVDAKALEEALAKANVKLTYSAPEELPNGIVGAGLRVSTQFTVPGNAPSDVVWQFGRALTAIDGKGGDSLLPGVGEVGATDPGSFQGPPSGSEPTVSSSEPPAAEVAASSGALSAGLGASPGRSGFASLPATAASDDTSSAGSAGAGEPAASPTGAAAPEVAAAPPPVAVARPASVSKGDDSGLYLLLVAGAAAVFVVAQVLGAVGVRGK